MEGLADHLGALREGRLVSQMPRDVLHRTLRRYRVELPDEWHAPPGFPLADERRGSGSREVQWTLRGEEEEMIGRLFQAGAQVRDVRPLGLEEAAITLLSERTP
jgi:ABC-2 type transport system ATP-binding protein